LSVLDTRLEALQAQDQALARELAADAPTTPDTAALHAVADQLARVIATGDTDQIKALLRILIADLRVNSRAEILPTYRVGALVVCAPTSSVDRTGQLSNRAGWSQDNMVGDTGHSANRADGAEFEGWALDVGA
jgi:hypothetical protein